jgi:spermidine synthase
LYKYATIGLVSCSVLMYEILLIRICALRLAFHFGFLVISNCLLAVGAGGTLLTVRQAVFRAAPRAWLFRFTIFYLLSLVATYVFLCEFPLGAEVTGLLSLSDPGDLARFTLFNTVAAVPFFFGGTVVGMLLVFNPGSVNRLYFVDLLGAGLGCLLTPALLPAVGAGGCLVALCLLSLFGTAAAAPPERRRLHHAATAVIAIAGAVLLPFLDRIYPVPGRAALDLSEQVRIDARQGVKYTRWTAISRIDLLHGPEEKGLIHGLGARRKGMPDLPALDGIVQDSCAGTTMVNFSDHPDRLVIIRRSLYSAALRLKQRPRVFIVGVGGGNDVWAAFAARARYVKAVELNAPIIEILTERYPRYARLLNEHPGIHFVVDEGRSALSRDASTYDVIQLTGVDTWTGLKSGAYVLAENYLYTREAIESMYDHLAPGGILQMTRMSEEMEALRMVSNLYAAFPPYRRLGFADSIMAIRTPDYLTAFMVKPDGFSRKEIRLTRRFIRRNGMDAVYLPGRNLRNRITEFVRTRDRRGFIERFPRDISPTVDDRPYFFNYHRFRDLWKSRRFLDEPSSVSQGNPFFIFIQLAISLALSILFIAVPLVGRRVERRGGAARYLVYFAGVGLGFIMVEVAMMQKLTVFLGHPVHSITVTLASVLVFAGLGSLVSDGWFEASPRKAWLVPLSLALLMGLFLWLWPRAVADLNALPLFGRVAVAVLALSPVSLTLGVPFAYGLRVLGQHNPSLLPWAWAVNGCASVVGSVLTVIVSMTAGFSAALVSAVGVYLIAFAALPATRRA